MGYVGRKRRSRVIVLVGGCVMVALAIFALLGAPTVGAATTATLNPGNVGKVGTTMPTDCGQGVGWIFVLPDAQGDAFVSISATFLTAGTVPGTVVAANDKFARVDVPLTDTLQSATAQIDGGHEGSTFNLSHVCAGEDGTTTTTVAETTTTAAETSTTAEETTTTVEDTTTTTAPETSTTIEETTTTIPETTTTNSTESTSTTTTTTTLESTTTTSIAVEATTIVSTPTTTPATSVPETTITAEGSTQPSITNAAVVTSTSAASASALPRTGSSESPPLIGLAALVLGSSLAALRRRRSAGS
jgi:LPXTG-motif cell wall-anchored protein